MLEIHEAVDLATFGGESKVKTFFMKINFFEVQVSQFT